MNISHLVESVAFESLTCPFTVEELASSVSRTAVQSVEPVSSKSVLIVVEAFCVALLSRRNPLPGSASVVVVLKVY